MIINFDPETKDIWIDIHLSNLPLFKRIIIAIKYIFGHKSEYGCFENFLISDEDSEKIIEVLSRKH